MAISVFSESPLKFLTPSFDSYVTPFSKRKEILSIGRGVGAKGFTFIKLGRALLHGFYRAMHYSAKRGLAIACRLSVCLSVCDVGGS